MARRHADNSTTVSAMVPPSAVAAAHLRQEIRQGRYEIGARLGDERSLAREFGVNRGTIRKALSILENELLITRRQGHGTFVTHASQPGQAKTDTPVSLIGAMVFGPVGIPEREYFYGAILRGAFSYCVTRGYMLAAASNSTVELETQHVEAFIKSGVRGVVLAPIADHSQEAYVRLKEANIPVILLDTRLPNHDDVFVGVDDFRGTEAATQHLLELGHKKIGYVGYENSHNVYQHWERLGGCLNACSRHGIQIPQAWRIEVPHDGGKNNFTDEAVTARLRDVLQNENRPTALVAYNDLVALPAVRVARSLGLEVPRDLSVVGFDDSAIASSYDVPLTTVSPEPEILATTMIDLLIARIENISPALAHSTMIMPRLVIRQSTAPPPK